MADRIKYDETGTLDEFVFDNANIHFERMDEAAWWMGIDLPDGTRYLVNCGALNPKAKGYVNIEPDMPAEGTPNG